MTGLNGFSLRKLWRAYKWVSLEMECVQTVSYSVLINGEPKGYFHPTRGLCQGDPISLYFFLLCAKGLHALLKKHHYLGKSKRFLLAGAIQS